VSDGTLTASDTFVLTVTAAPSGLVAAYGFNEGSGTTVADVSGNGNNGAIGSATWTTAGKYGGALSFNGSNARVTVPDANSLDLNNAMTLEAWVFPTTLGGWREVICKVDDIYYLMGSSDTTTPAVRVNFGASMRGPASLALNTWTHLAGTYDGATLRLYVNGVQVASQARSGLIPASTGALTFGGDALYGQYFAGRIDEVRIYNRALSVLELASDMNTPVSDTTTAFAAAAAGDTSGPSPTPLEQPKLSIVFLPDRNKIMLRIDRLPSEKYAVEASVDLLTWAPVGVVFDDTGVSFLEDNDAGEYQRRFYRLMHNP
jgi:hypothetical protein